ncbi:SOS response-associated peptidase [Thiohalocapsa marina]|uniref:Abasic site processing protein n=1 Tax=Thiohalocapsa marina TaxID=424902 RepID=A0A5M8FPA1_9GAMM|nr:SOS response-associated peptidase [Thiohalocapsa marina]KAA6184255.1 SOS response-associated peptidase [Thiohalocapsa marina]
MCGRFVQSSDQEVLEEHFGLDQLSAVSPRYNVAPTQPVLAIRAEQTDVDRRELVQLRWGLVPAWSKGPDHRYSMINARAESVADKPAYRNAFRQRRCLIPADGFYEWQTGADGKQPFLIRRADGAPFAMAGLWEHWQGEHWQGPEGRVIDSCTILVTDANALLAPIHDRMPVILDPADYALWLDPGMQDRQRLQALLQPVDPAGWIAYPVSRAVNRATNDDPRLLDPVS